MTKELLTTFDSSTQEFCALAKSVNIFKLHAVPAPGEWSAAYVIHHLADSDAQFLVRFINVLTIDRPAIVPFDEDSFPGGLRYKDRSIAISLNAIEASRAQLVDILSQLDDEAWNRAGIHSERGELSLSTLLQFTTDHRVGHIEQLKGLI